MFIGVSSEKALPISKFNLVFSCDSSSKCVYVCWSAVKCCSLSVDLYFCSRPKITNGRSYISKIDKCCQFILSVPQQCNRSFSALLTRYGSNARMFILFYICHLPNGRVKISLHSNIWITRNEIQPLKNCSIPGPKLTKQCDNVDNPKITTLDSI